MVCKKNIIQEGPQRHSKPFYFGIIIIFALLGLYGAVYGIDQILPIPLHKSDEVDNPNNFIAERAYTILKGLVDIGPRIVGSVENEVLAIDYLLMVIDDIIKDCHKDRVVDYDLQMLSGSFYLNYQPYGSINAYQNLQNLVIRLGGDNNASDSVLVNAHFDTMPNSPGASDDGIMCAVMLEVIRNVCKIRSFKNNVIFLFNGAEESYLQGSHAFISHANKWNDSVKVVVNLEATGAGGKEMLFQAGPEQAWLLKYYKEVPHPHAQAAGEELFQSNLIPSDTDFRIFRDFGNTIGYDLAYTRNGYRYHTEFDDLDNIDLGTFQHTGDNVLALIKGLANADEVSKPRVNPEKPVFYDFIGLFLIRYNQTAELIINVLTILLSVTVSVKAFYDFKLLPSLVTLRYLTCTILGIIVSWLASIGFVIAIGSFLDALEFSMGWYGHPWVIFLIYALPVLTTLLGITLLVNKFNRYKHFTISMHTQVQLHTNRLIWTLVLLVGTCLRIRSVYLFVPPILFTAFAFFLVQCFQKQLSIHTWHYLYMTFTIIPTMFSMYFSLEIFGLFVPICGRLGWDTNPEFIIGLFAAAFTILVTSFYVPIIAISRKSMYIFIALLITFLIGFVIYTVYFIINKSSGYPYSTNPNNIAPQRYWLYHTKRTLRIDNKTVSNEAAITFSNMDRNSPRSIEFFVGFMNSIASKSLADDCEKYLYCGLPVMYTSEHEAIANNILIDTKWGPIITEPVSLQLLSKELISTDIYRYSFKSNGTSHYNIYISPKENMTLIRTNLLETIPTNQPKWNGRDTYFILYVDGKMRSEFIFDFDIKVVDEVAMVDMAIAATYYDEKVTEKAEDYINFIKSFPDWVTLNAWTGSYENWVF